MKRFHVHLSVPDLATSIRFYSGLFGLPPTVAKPDYAKWMLDDPRINFAISQRGRSASGLNHLGIQAETQDELAALRTGFAAADGDSTVDEPNANCCYVKSDKHWVTDPQGIAWEAFHTLESIPMFDRGAADSVQATQAAGGCCTPAKGSTIGEPARCCAAG